MKTRLNFYAVSPKALEPMMALEAHFKQSALEPILIDLVKMRASQINGCAYCLHMHSRDARARGEGEDRLYLLNAWRESSLYTDRERAALAWTEALTLVAQTGAPDADFEGLKPHFSEVEIVDLTLLITTINAWNRIAIGFRAQHPRAWEAKLEAA
jgi:AhpD family alkylhydroperoxidase